MVEFRAHRIHGTNGIFIYLHLPYKFTFHVGEYTIPSRELWYMQVNVPYMDPIGRWVWSFSNQFFGGRFAHPAQKLDSTDVVNTFHRIVCDVH